MLERVKADGNPGGQNSKCAPQIQDNMVGKGVLYILTINHKSREHTMHFSFICFNIYIKHQVLYICLIYCQSCFVSLV